MRELGAEPDGVHRQRRVLDQGLGRQHRPGLRERPEPASPFRTRTASTTFEALNACAAKLKNASSDFKDENQVYITANPGTDYQTVIAVIDALRTTPQGDVLFDDVNFKVPR